MHIISSDPTLGGILFSLIQFFYLSLKFDGKYTQDWKFLKTQFVDCIHNSTVLLYDLEDCK